MQKEYDYIVTGGGAAGRSFIAHLLKSPLKGKRVLLIDLEPKLKNDRTWSFWEKDQGFFEDIVYHSWDKLWVYTDSFNRLLSISPYRYKLIRGIDFYQYTNKLIDQHPNIERLFAKVDAIDPQEKGVEVKTDKGTFFADWCFNSIFFGKIEKEKVNYLDQHFRGWFIKTKVDVFDSEQATLMDFRTPQEGETRFLYVLPHSKREALVEVAIFSNEHLMAEDYDQILSNYLKEHFPHIKDYTIEQVEMGNIPMTDYPFEMQNGRIIHLGMSGGDTRASSGYTFFNIQRRVANIIEQLIDKNHPEVAKSWPQRRAQWYDKLMLHVLEQGYYPGDLVFEKLFSKNDPRQVLAFLNAETKLLKEIRVANTLPKGPFLKALWKESLFFLK